MPTTIKLKNSVTTTNAPSSLVQGEVAINITDKKVWVGNAATTPIQLLGDGASLNFTSLSLSGNITFTGTGNRITGDFSNATIANRVAFQSSTTDTNTTVGLLPNGTAISSLFTAYNSSDPTNTSFTQIGMFGTESRITSGITGTGTYRNLTIYTGGSERLRIDTSGNVGIGTSSPGARLDILQVSNGTVQARIQNSSTGSSASANITVGNGTTSGQFVQAGTSYGGYGAWLANETLVYASTNLDLMADSGSGVIKFATGGNTERMRIDSSGNVGIGTSTLNGAKLFVAQGAAQSPATSGNMTTGMITGSGATGEALNIGTDADGVWYNAAYANNAGVARLHRWLIGGTERMRITSGGNLYAGRTTDPSIGSAKLVVQNDTGTFTTVFTNNAGNMLTTWGTGSASTGWNAADSVSYWGKQASTNRTINAAGTINASGADYAEYMTKAGDFIITKGDICGIDVNGKLTNVFADSIAFVVKSTDPSYVGGDTWGVGLKDDELESARQKVDRIAFAGQVPINVLGATAGQYIIPVDDNGSIKGQAVSNPTFEQYQIAVGKVIAIESDGRAKIIVKIA